MRYILSLPNKLAYSVSKKRWLHTFYNTCTWQCDPPCLFLPASNSRSCTSNDSCQLSHNYTWRALLPHMTETHVKTMTSVSSSRHSLSISVSVCVCCMNVSGPISGMNFNGTYLKEFFLQVENILVAFLNHSVFHTPLRKGIYSLEESGY
jgi:hypothetical protein